MHYDQRVAVHVPVCNLYNLWFQTVLFADCYLKYYQDSSCQDILAGI